MAVSRSVWNQLKAILITADELIRALEKDGWVDEDRRGATRGFVKNIHGGGRQRVVIHYHPGKTYGQKLLKALLDSTAWTDGDLKRLKLIKRA